MVRLYWFILPALASCTNLPSLESSCTDDQDKCDAQSLIQSVSTVRRAKDTAKATDVVRADLHRVTSTAHIHNADASTKLKQEPLWDEHSPERPSWFMGKMCRVPGEGCGAPPFQECELRHEVSGRDDAEARRNCQDLATAAGHEFFNLGFCPAPHVWKYFCITSATCDEVEVRPPWRMYRAPNTDGQPADDDVDTDTCSVGDDVTCPDDPGTRCAGDQCCPSGATCPSASVPHHDGCSAPKDLDCTVPEISEPVTHDPCSEHRTTPGTCRWRNCYSWRGETECINGQCVCAPGLCSANEIGGRHGVCVTPDVWEQSQQSH